MPFDLGDTVRLTAQCKDPAGAPADAAGVTLTLTLPDGATASPAVTNPPAATGQYSVDYTTVQEGRHGVRWVFTSPDDAYTDVFDVRPAEPGLILSLADAKTHLNITSTRSDEEIRGWLETVTEVVAGYTGVTVQRSFTELVSLPSLGARSFVLRRTPVVSLTSLAAVDGASAVSVDALDVDIDTGVVRRKNGGLLSGLFRVTYLAGRTAVPPAISKAALIILQHMWLTQRNASRGPVPGGGDDFSIAEPVPGLGYAVPNRALQLMEPYRLPPGVA